MWACCAEKKRVILRTVDFKKYSQTKGQPLDFLLCRRYGHARIRWLTNAMSLRPSTPSSEKEPLRFSKSLSFNADTGMMF